MGRPYKCPYCALTNTVSKGRRKTKTMGLRSIRRCRSCHRKFTPKNQRPDAEEAAGPQPQVTEAQASDENQS